ncbi:MAG: hypothetical protein M3141_02405, partial [Actinomycetota bacterium]|nr:hypothetical protein [Actinomycetota bacterium]
MAAGVLRRASQRLRASGAQRRRYEAFRAQVEPGIAPRVHRFAAAPRVLGDLPPVPLAVCIDTESGGDTAATLASLDRQSVAPVDVTRAPGLEALSPELSDWLVLVRTGDRLAPTALETLGCAVAAAPDAALITCDEDRLDRRGRRANPVCRPGPSPDFMLAHDLTGSLIAVRREAAHAAA